MYSENPPLTLLPSDESQFDMPTRPGWKAERLHLKHSKRCGHCHNTIQQGSEAVVVNRADPEKYAKENNLTVPRAIAFCNVTCQRANYFKALLANPKSS